MKTAAQFLPAFLGLVLCATAFADAPTYGTLEITAEQTDIHSGASLSSKVEGIAEQGDTFTLRGDKLYNGFYKIQNGKHISFVLGSKSRVVKDEAAATPQPAEAIEKATQVPTRVRAVATAVPVEEQEEATAVPTPLRKAATALPSEGQEEVAPAATPTQVRRVEMATPVPGGS